LISIPVTSDVLPDRLEKKMHALITKTFYNTQGSLVTLALSKWFKKDIYEAGSNNRRIDKEKLKEVMTTHHRIYIVSGKLLTMILLQ
jgi:membrane protein YqaA with SNARE-associated domain